MNVNASFVMRIDEEKGMISEDRAEVLSIELEGDIEEIIETIKKVKETFGKK